MFTGLSTLRKLEKKPKELTQQAKAMQDYLKRYSGEGGETGDKAKKKKRKKKVVEPSGVRIVDEDVSGFKDPAVDQEEYEDDAPAIANPEEAERLKRLAAMEEKAVTAWQATGGGSNGGLDASPLRRQRHASLDASPPRRQQHASSDASPPRRQRHDSLDASPPRRQRHDSPDASPPRRRQRQGSPDASPPRRRQRHDSPDASPPRRQRHDSPDASPPRRRQRQGSEDANPLRRQRHDSPDASPPRRRQRQGSPDASPPRRQRHDSPDASPPRRRQRQGSQDASPPRRQRHDSRDGSLPLKRQQDGRDAVHPPGTVPMKRPRMADGAAGGIMSGKELAAEVARKRVREAEKFAALSDEATGRGAKTVYRNKEGKVVDDPALLREKKAVKHESEKELAWGGGLEQRRLAEEAASRRREEAAMPFARSRDDAALNAELRDRTRWGDPMAKLVKQKEPDAAAPAPLLTEERAKKSGFVIPQQIPPHSWLRRGIGPPLNRYGIKPGRHWDGVDRSNGFERDMFKMQNARKSRAQDEYAYATADM